MKKTLLLVAVSALFSTAALAQPTTPAQTDVNVRDNGTVKATTTVGDEKVTTKTGKTNVGAALDNTKDATGNVARKAGRGVKKGAKATARVAKRGAKATSRTVRKGAQKTSGAVRDVTEKAEQKTEK